MTRERAGSPSRRVAARCGTVAARQASAASGPAPLRGRVAGADGTALVTRIRSTLADTPPARP